MVAAIIISLIGIAAIFVAVFCVLNIIKSAKLFVLASNENPYYSRREAYYKRLGFTDKTKAKRGNYMIVKKSHIQVYLIIIKNDYNENK